MQGSTEHRCLPTLTLLKSCTASCQICLHDETNAQVDPLEPIPFDGDKSLLFAVDIQYHGVAVTDSRVRRLNICTIGLHHLCCSHATSRACFPPSHERNDRVRLQQLSFGVLYLQETPKRNAQQKRSVEVANAEGAEATLFHLPFIATQSANTRDRERWSSLTKHNSCRH